MKKLSNPPLKQKSRKALPPAILKKTPLRSSRAGKACSARVDLVPSKPRGSQRPEFKALPPSKRSKLKSLKEAMLGIAKAGLVIKTASRTLNPPSKSGGKGIGKNAATELTDNIQASSRGSSKNQASLKKQTAPRTSDMKSSAASRKTDPAKSGGKGISASKPASEPKASALSPMATVKSKKPGTSVKSSNGRSRAAASLRNGSSRNEVSLGEAVCREVACEGLATTAGYCRLHYIKNWKKIKRKEQILSEGKLNQYIEELVLKYPDKYIEAIRQDLSSEKEFAKVIYDLDLDESVDEFDIEGETVDSLIDTIKRDFDDEGETGF